MKVKVIRDAHDTTIGKVYNTIPAPQFTFDPDAVWVVDDIGEEYVLYKDEYEVVE